MLINTSFVSLFLLFSSTGVSPQGSGQPGALSAASRARDDNRTIDRDERPDFRDETH